MLENELARLQSSWPDPLNTMEIRGDLESLLYAMTKLGSRFPLVGSYLFTPVLSSERCLIGVQRTIQQRFKPAWMANRAFLRLSIDVAHARPMDSPLQYGHRSPDSIEDTVMHSRSFTNYHVHYLHSLSRLFSLGAAWPSSTCFESV